MPFGETALFRHSFSASGRGAKKAKYGKADLKLEAGGVFMGRTVDSNEYFFGTPSGVHTSRTVKRLPVADQMHVNTIKSMIGVPWEARSEAPRGRPPRQVWAPTEVVAQPAPDRPEGQDQGV
eukprot:283603-Heterocapsa_arctica.AAC.1